MNHFGYLAVLFFNGFAAYLLWGTIAGYLAAGMFVFFLLGGMRFGIPAPNPLSEFSGFLLLISLAWAGWLWLTGGVPNS